MWLLYSDKAALLLCSKAHMQSHNQLWHKAHIHHVFTETVSMCPQVKLNQHTHIWSLYCRQRASRGTGQCKNGNASDFFVKMQPADSVHFHNDSRSAYIWSTSFSPARATGGYAMRALGRVRLSAGARPPWHETGAAKSQAGGQPHYVFVTSVRPKLLDEQLNCSSG